jgi:hypothetical protein
VLISREVLPIWVWERWHGHHDLLIVHVTFHHPPVLEAEMVDPDNELGRRGAAQVQAYHWSSSDFSRWRLYSPPGTPSSHLETIAKRIAAGPFGPWRLALRRNAPHLLLSMSVPDLEQTHSRQLVHLLTELSKLTRPVPGERNP